MTVDVRLSLVSLEREGSLCLLAVFVHQNLLLMVKSHANVSVIVFLVLGHLLQEMLIVHFWTAGAEISFERREFLVQMSLYINISYDLAWMEHRACSFWMVQFECRLRNFAEWRPVSLWLNGGHFHVHLVYCWTFTLDFLRNASFVGRLWVEATVIIILDRFKVGDCLPESPFEDAACECRVIESRFALESWRNRLRRSIIQTSVFYTVSFLCPLTLRVLRLIPVGT